jgi:hypothetical protein
MLPVDQMPPVPRVMATVAAGLLRASFQLAYRHRLTVPALGFQ